MVTLRAHFDGRVLVPEGPVDLPQGRVLEVRVEEVGEVGMKGAGHEAGEFGVSARTGLPVVKVPEGGPTITLEDVARAEEEW
jgi:hypothetical protein